MIEFHALVRLTGLERVKEFSKGAGDAFTFGARGINAAPGAGGILVRRMDQIIAGLVLFFQPVLHHRFKGPGKEFAFACPIAIPLAAGFLQRGRQIITLFIADQLTSLSLRQFTVPHF